MKRKSKFFIEQITGGHPYCLTDNIILPNIYFISVDEIPPEFYRSDSPYTEQLDIPNIKALASDSITFTNAFCNSPLCSPSRASYLTGRYSYITTNEERAHDGHETVLRPDDSIFPEYLKSIGYLTKHIGKCHVGTKKFMDAFGENDRPWNRWDPPLTENDDYLLYLSDLGTKPMRYHAELKGLQQDRKTDGLSFGGWIDSSRRRLTISNRSYISIFSRT